jgi:hypothetical protein
MNSTEAIREESAHLEREYVVEGLSGDIHGAAFSGRLLRLAAGDWLVRFAPETGRLVDRFQTFPDPGGLADDGRFLWQHSEGELQQIDPRTGFVLRSIAPQLSDIAGLECIGDDLLVLHAGGRALARVETRDLKMLGVATVSNVELSAPMRGLTWVGRGLWSSTASSTSGALCRIDPASGRISARLALPAGVEICDLAGDAQGHLWGVDGRSRVARAFSHRRS